MRSAVIRLMTVTAVLIAGVARPVGACPGNVNGDPFTNINDLLAVIAAWGPCAGCPEDITGNGVVNIEDMLAVITDWGCIEPINNLCANASTAVNGFNLWNNADASTDGPAVGSCQSSITRDIWFRYTATCTGRVFIDTAGSLGNVNTTLAVYNGNSCPPGTLLACDRDNGPALLSSVTVPVTAGQIITIRVGSQGAGPEGAGVLNIACDLGLAPPNDSCSAAAPAVTGVNPGTNLDATTDGPNGSACDALITRDVWFNYTAVCTGVATISTAGTPFDTVLAVYDTWACPSLLTPWSLLACNDDAAPPGVLTSVVTVPVSMGQALKIRVGSWEAAAAEGPIVLTITCP